MIQVFPSKHSFFTFDQCRWIRPQTHLSTLDGICSSFLQQLDGLVVIQRPAPAHHVTQELHAVQLSICVLRPRVINQTNLHQHTIHNVRKCNRTYKRAVRERKDVSHVPCPEDCKGAWRVLCRTPVASEGPSDGSSSLYPGIPNRWFLEDCLDTHKPLETPENVK